MTEPTSNPELRAAIAQAIDDNLPGFMEQAAFVALAADAALAVPALVRALAVTALLDEWLIEGDEVFEILVRRNGFNDSLAHVDLDEPMFVWAVSQ